MRRPYAYARAQRLHQTRPPRDEKAKTAKLWWSNSIHQWCVLTPFIEKTKNREFNFMLELQCDASFKPSVSAWTFDDEKLGVAEELLTRFFGRFDKQERVEIPVFTPESSALERHKNDFCALTGLVVTELTLARAKRAYIHTTKLLHPDLGGDAAKMAALNVAWQEIKDSLS